MDDDQEVERRRLRKLWRKYNAAHEKVAEEWRARGYQYPPPVFPPIPPELVGLTCGAKTRAGTPCKRKDLYASGRCPLHEQAVKNVRIRSSLYGEASGKLFSLLLFPQLMQPLRLGHADTANLGSILVGNSLSDLGLYIRHPTQ